MSIDIAEKLIPNILTMLAQLCATGLIFVMYRKFLHDPVQKYLDARSLKMVNDLKEAEALKEESLLLRDKAKQEHDALVKNAKALELQMLDVAKQERQEIIDSAQPALEAQRLRLEADIVQERQDLYDEVSSHMLTLAVDVNRKVLEDVEFNHETMLRDIELAMSHHD